MFRLGLLLLVIACGVLFFTNPSHEVHRQTVLTAAATDATNSSVLGKIAVDLLGNRDVLPLTYNNYYVCSTTTLNGKTASFGLFSRVWKLEK